MKTPLEKQYPHLTAHARARIGLILSGIRAAEWAISSNTPDSKGKRQAIRMLRRAGKMAIQVIVTERKLPQR